MTQCVSENNIWIHNVLDILLDRFPQFVGLFSPAFPVHEVSTGLVIGERTQGRHPWGAWGSWVGGHSSQKETAVVTWVSFCKWAEWFRHRETSQHRLLSVGCRPGALAHCHLSCCSQQQTRELCSHLCSFPCSLKPREQALSYSWLGSGIWHESSLKWAVLVVLQKNVLGQHLFLIKRKLIIMQNVGCYSQNKRNLCEAVSKGKDLSKAAQYERNCNFSCHWYSLLNWW